MFGMLYDARVVIVVRLSYCWQSRYRNRDRNGEESQLHPTKVCVPSGTIEPSRDEAELDTTFNI